LRRISERRIFQEVPNFLPYEGHGQSHTETPLISTRGPLYICHQTCIISKGQRSCPNAVYKASGILNTHFIFILLAFSELQKSSKVCRSDFWMQISTFVRNKHEALPND
jgi:hypothetical protein